MSEKNKKVKKKKEKLRIVILNDATFEEKFAFRATQKKLIIWGSVAAFIALVLLIVFIAFTPLKRLMPGYASIDNNIYVIKMKNYVDDLEKQINLQEKYNATLRKLLVGEGDSLILPENYQFDQGIQETNLDKEFEEIYGIDDQRLGKSAQNGRTLEKYYFIPPLSGKVNHAVDFKTGHYGVDIAGPKNAPIKAIMEGIVVFSDYTTETGYTIAIQHPNDMLSIYKHNDKLLKNEGNFVANGEAIAIIGNTGTLSDGPHLHFELWYKSTPLNPEDYILFE